MVEFTPSGFDHPVEAYEAVDAGSVPTQTKWNTVEVSYSTSNPREVQIVGGTRRHRWLNAAFLFAEGPILFVVLTGAGGLISRFFAGRKAGPSRSTGQG